MVKADKLKRRIVEGEYVATEIDMEAVNGVDHVFDWIHLVDGQTKMTDQGDTCVLLPGAATREQNQLANDSQ